LGGHVERSPAGWGVGVQGYDVVATAPWMRPARDRFQLIASHEDQITVTPRDVTVFATSEYCPIAGLALGNRIWTVQAHPEFVPPLADHLLAGRVELIGVERVAAARRTLERPLDQRAFAQWIANTAAERG
jgi:GMP synthase-like glutamine amidotransferase